MVVLGRIGIGLLVAGVLAIVVELVLMAIWGLAIGRQAVVLSKRLESDRVEIHAQLERLTRAVEETRRLWQPYRRILRWLRHPLVLALLGSYRRRMAAR
jgi:hypothetical protein